LRGGLPGPVVWKHCRACVSARFKSTFWKRVSRLSCSSCQGIGFTSCDWTGATGYETFFSELNVILEVNRFKGKPERINHYLKVKLLYRYKVNSLNALSFVLE